MSSKGTEDAMSAYSKDDEVDKGAVMSDKEGTKLLPGDTFSHSYFLLILQNCFNIQNSYSTGKVMGKW